MQDSPAFAERTTAFPDLTAHRDGVGRDLFGNLRRTVSTAEQGACTLFEDDVATDSADTRRAAPARA